MASSPSVITVAVEGLLDEAVAVRLIRHVGAEPGPVYGKSGKAALLGRIAGYNNAARYEPWFVLIDLNGDEECAPTARRQWLAALSPRMCFRIVVREMEAWLLADRTPLARFLGVREALVPAEAERVDKPKEVLVNLGRSSSHRAIREGLVPRPGSGRRVGAEYTSKMIEFVSRYWRPEEAAKRAASLARAIRCLRRIAGRPAE